MGLFTSDKNPCAICGGPTSRFVPYKFDDKAVCKHCFGKASADDDILNSMSLEAFKIHLAYREENERILANFHDTKVVPFCISEKLHIDADQELLYIESSDRFKTNPPVFKFSELRSFVYYEQRNTNKFLGIDVGRDRCPLIIKRGEHFEEASFALLLRDKYEGVIRDENVWEHLFNTDERMLASEYPILVFRITFEFDNPYHKRLAFDYLRPILNLKEDNALFYSTVLKTYLERCDSILKDAQRLGRAVEPILNP